jgi:hypothetical protein
MFTPLTPVKVASPVSVTGEVGAVYMYYWPVSMTPVRHNVTGVIDTSKECIAAVVVTDEVRSDTNYFILNLFYTKLTLVNCFETFSSILTKHKILLF